MIQLRGKLTVQRISGSINVVPTSGSPPLQGKVVIPNHEEQLIKPDAEYYGLSVVTVAAVPRLPACEAKVRYGNPISVDHRVDLDIGISVEAERYYSHALFNGVRLPRIPGALENYKYFFIRVNADKTGYDLVASNDKWYYKSSSRVLSKVTSPYQWYTIIQGATTWSNKMSLDDGGPFSIPNGMLWSNFDIFHNSIDGTSLYHAGSEFTYTE